MPLHPVPPPDSRSASATSTYSSLHDSTYTSVENAAGPRARLLLPLTAAVLLGAWSGAEAPPAAGEPGDDPRVRVLRSQLVGEAPGYGLSPVEEGRVAHVRSETCGREVRCRDGVDLRLLRMEFPAPDGRVPAGVRYPVRLEVQNGGTRRSEAVRVRACWSEAGYRDLCVEGTEGWAEVPALPSGRTVRVTVPLPTPAAERGGYVVATLDPEEERDDARRGNGRKVSDMLFTERPRLAFRDARVRAVVGSPDAVRLELRVENPARIARSPETRLRLTFMCRGGGDAASGAVRWRSEHRVRVPAVGADQLWEAEVEARGLPSCGPAGGDARMAVGAVIDPEGRHAWAGEVEGRTTLVEAPRDRPATSGF